MSEPTYTLTLTDAERQMLANTFGLLTRKLMNAPAVIASIGGVRPFGRELEDGAQAEAPNGGTQAARAILAPAPNIPPSPSPAVAPHLPTAVRDRWARDRNGNEVPNPAGCETVERFLSKLDNKPLADGRPRMFVGWEAPNGNGFVQGSCFDKALFPWLILRQKSGEKTVLHVMSKGKYLNVVGVRA